MLHLCYIYITVVLQYYIYVTVMLQYYIYVTFVLHFLRRLKVNLKFNFKNIYTILDVFRCVSRYISDTFQREIFAIKKSHKYFSVSMRLSC